jgi:hypothetical protein
MPGRKAMPPVSMPGSVRNKTKAMVRISIDETDALQVLKEYGEEAYNAFRAKQLRCILHPEEERAIYVEPKK